jgi:alginate O-acetyltransferase complex protein AlgI
VVFASLTFLYLFLPISALLYFAWNNITYRNIVLTLVSLVFYAWGEPVWVILLLFSSGVDWAHGLLVERFRGRWQAKAALISCLTINLGLLGAFKYGALITETLNALLPVALPVPEVALPVGSPAPLARVKLAPQLRRKPPTQCE